MPQEITIIGGNVAGLASAYYLSKKGINVTVYESKIWNKPCGGAISLEFDYYLRNVLSVFLEGSDHFTERFRVGMWNGRCMEDEGIFRIISRHDLQEKLINRIEKEEGVTINFKQVSIRDNHLFTPQTIVATGYSGFSQKIFRRKWHPSEFAFTIRYDGIIEEGKFPNTNLIILDSKKMGYGWIFIGKGNHVNIGVGALAPREYVWKKYYELFNIIKEKYGYYIDTPQAKPKCWILPMLVNKLKYPVNQKQNGIEFIGVGDTLGLAHAISGAGIEPAWMSGWVLAESLNDKRQINVKKYTQLLKVNLRKTVWRRTDHLLSFLSRKPIPFKSSLGYYSLHIVRHRMIKMMRKYPWFAFVHNGIRETGFSLEKMSD
ncbi:NAD(P)-binding protein [Candidatus Hodarchaeum mangrovi]